jgi:mRNA interferase MazF
MRGDIYRLSTNPHARDHEQQGPRYAVVVQSDALLTSTVIAVPTSASARASAHRPEIRIGKQRTRVLVEQIQAVDSEKRFGPKVGRLTPDEEQEVAEALRRVLGLH